MDTFSRIRQLYAAAVQRAPGLARQLATAGVRAEDILGPATLNRIPVLKKEQFLALQAAEPPFGGFLACDLAEVGHIYVSPGPIIEPSLSADTSGHGMQTMCAEAGIGPGDIALNTWSYHLVPAGLLFDRALRACGATVIPAGTGNTELLADLLVSLRPTAFLGSAANFQNIVDQIRRSGREIPREWAVRHAFLAGEFGDWSVKRRTIEQALSLKTWTCYGTADFGLIGYERPGREGYRIHPDRYVQICDPDSGEPVPLGDAGEIVVTTLAQGWPLIRFGTGDLGRAASVSVDGGVEWLTSVEGRVGAARKIREIFVYPDHIRQLTRRIEGLAEARLRVGRVGNREVITLEVLPLPGAHVDDEAIGSGFRALTRLRADRIIRVSNAAAFTHPDILGVDTPATAP
jgi:phenylacetate-CoA ligase